MELEELLPPKPEFFLKSKNRSFVIRPPNLHDQVWFKSRYGTSTGFASALSNGDWNEISRVVYHLLSDADRREFLAQDVKVVNDEGEEKVVRHTGPEVFLLAIDGLEEITKIMGALTRAIMISNPAIEEDVKKQVAEAKAKAPRRQRPTSPSSSTSSGTSTESSPKK